MKGGEWCRHCDTALGYYWFSDDTSEGRLSASGDLESWSHGNDGGWITQVVDGDGWGNLIFLDCSWLQITETSERKTVNNGGLLIYKQ